ncbi:hypothetical protein [Peribacillus muralis]|uniref:hypothetical protein n=1 Tax=Peribacillus muralis TaxID=264697 RepID=UPI003D03EE04
MKNQTQLLCVNENHGIESLFVEEGKSYGLFQDNYGEFFEDEKGNEHYLADLDWDSIFNMVGSTN